MKVSVIGTGNVGTTFARIFGVEPVSPRTLSGLPQDSDLYIIAVSDSAVKDVADRLPSLRGIVVHTTGSVPLDALKDVRCKGTGVFYPFQTISRKRLLSPSDIPLLLEASDSDTLAFLKKTAEEAGFTDIAPADSEKRRKVHLAGVFANNFTNAMIGISRDILEECGISPSIVNPLVAETIDKLKSIPAREAQTGPAVRKDIPTLEKHMEMLRQFGMCKESEIYSTVSDYIMECK